VTGGGRETVPRRRPAVGLRREVALLFPVALLLIVSLASYTLLSYRSAVSRLLDERGEIALRAARETARALVASDAPLDPAALQRQSPAIEGLRGLSLYDAEGRPVAETGQAAGPLAAALATGSPPELAGRVGPGLVVGPGGRHPDGLLALVPLVAGGERHYLGVEVATPLLASRQRELRVLTVVVLGVGVALAVLLLLFLRRLVVPYDRLVERARRAEGHGELTGDEDVELLVRTFERGIAAMARPDADGPDRDLAALERTLAASLESGLLILDAEGRTVALNPVGAKLLGVPPPAPGTPVAEALAPHPALAALLAEAVGERRALQRQEVGLDSPSGRLTLGLTVHPLRVGASRPGADAPGRESAPGEVRGFLVLFADLTEARRQAEEDRLADRLGGIGELAAGVAHEMRNGLATLQGYLTLLQRSDEAAAAAYAGEMRRETDHLHRVLSDFLSFARPGSVRAEPVPAGRVLRRAAADPALAGAPVQVVAPEGEGPVLQADPQLLERALRNLVHNAVEASREAAGEGGPAPVVARLRSAGDTVEIVVEDRGPGIPPDLRDRVFDPFVTGRREGVGLGLALAHRIVRLHGGSLALEDRPGGGTVARVRLPVAVVSNTEGNDQLEP